MKDKENNQILINSFRGKYFFLSNFYPCQINYKGKTYQSTEAAFQAQKVLNDAIQWKFTGLSPRDARTYGKKVELRPDWEDVKDEIMDVELLACRLAEFLNENYKELLCARYKLENTDIYDAPNGLGP